MRIVFAVHAYAPAVGGAERYAQDLAEAFVLAGHEVHVLTPNRISAESFYEYGHELAGTERDSINGVTLHRIPLNSRGRSARHTKQTGRTISDRKARAMWERYAKLLSVAMDRIGPDATITLPHSFPNVSAALNSTSRGITVYAPLLHEADPAWRITPVADLVAKSDVVLAMTEWERDRLVEAYRSSPDQTYVAPPAVNAPEIDSVKPHKLGHPYVVAIGRRTSSKNLLASARAIRSLNAQGYAVRLLIAGPGTDPVLDRELRNFDDLVNLVGEISEEHKWSLIKGSLASVSMSASESYGIGNAEAWAMGRPAIARRVGPIGTIVDDGVDGFLVNDEEELAEKLALLLTDAPRADRMGVAGSKKLDHSSSSAAATVLSAISAALDRRYTHRGNGGTSFDDS